MRFFISSTFTDLIKYRKIAINMLSGLTCTISAMESFPASIMTPKDVCLSELESSDIVIGIYGSRYGSIDKESNLSMTELEFIKAREMGKPILAFVLKGRKEPRQQKFVDKIYKTKINCAPFSNKKEFIYALNESLKVYFNSLDGYDYNSLWDDIFQVEKEKQKNTPIYIESLLMDDEERCIEELNNANCFFDQLMTDVADIHDIVYQFAYNENYGYKNSLESKDEMIKNIRKESSKIVSLWEPLHIGRNHLQRIRIICAFLRLSRVKYRLIEEVWTDELRLEALAAKDNYINVIRNIGYLD